MATFVEIERPDPTNDLGPEYGIFDRYGMLAASYRTYYHVVRVWTYSRHDASVGRFLIMNNEDLARLFCEAVARERGLPDAAADASPPDLDQMLRDLTR